MNAIRVPRIHLAIIRCKFHDLANVKPSRKESPPKQLTAHLFPRRSLVRNNFKIVKKERYDIFGAEWRDVRVKSDLVWTTSASIKETGWCKC
jgi:hypothetical protein